MRSVWELLLSIRLRRPTHRLLAGSTGASVTVVALLTLLRCMFRTRSLNMTDGTLHLPSGSLGRIRLNSCGRGSIVTASRACATGGHLPALNDLLRKASLAKVTIPLKDLFRGNVGVIFEEAGIIEDGLKIFRDLKRN